MIKLNIIAKYEKNDTIYTIYFNKHTKFNIFNKSSQTYKEKFKLKNMKEEFKKYRRLFVIDSHVGLVLTAEKLVGGNTLVEIMLKK